MTDLKKGFPSGDLGGGTLQPAGHSDAPCFKPPVEIHRRVVDGQVTYTYASGCDGTPIAGTFVDDPTSQAQPGWLFTPDGKGTPLYGLILLLVLAVLTPYIVRDVRNAWRAWRSNASSSPDSSS